MGMAASQARLLSITSRMSDNELRSQLINNAKMRLTTDSSKASEKYLAALNATQLMFSNYSLTGDSQYQQLTFNSLTAYSAYNNQYGLANKGGELLVSELDTARYEDAFTKANADNSIEEGDIDGRNAKALEEFLKSYGLVKDTTYFERDALYKDIDPKIKEMYEGNMVYEFHGATETSKPYAERISGIHYGYEESIKSKDYGIYQSLLKDYTSAKTVWNAITLQSRQDYIETLTHNETGIGNPYSATYKEVIEWANSLEYNDDGTLKDASSHAGTALKFQEAMQDIYNKIYNEGKYAANPKSVNEGGGNVNRGGNFNNYADEEGELLAFHRRMQFYLDLTTNGGTYKEDPTQAYKRQGFDIGIPTAHFGDDGLIDYYYYEISETDENFDKPYVQPQEPLEYLGKPVKEIVLRQVTQEEYVQSIVDMYRFFQGEVLDALDEGAFREEYIQNAGLKAQKDGKNVTEAEAAAAKKFDEAQSRYMKASKELSLFIFGQDIGVDQYEHLDDLEWIIYGPLQDPTDPDSGRTNAPLYPTTALDPSEGGIMYDMNFPVAGSLEEGELPYPANFQVVKDVYLCEKMMELYGTPSYTWIDINNPDENADKKAEWYTNLFNRMLEGGYQTIENGLASSSEWLQFALESGLISMEQVDIKQKWTSTMYSNCSNITESQIDVDITIAEAEYKKTMNEIEAKDKRYDIELKNIDTEHQSLQTEYDVIKSVIDKNVQRNFKMFEA